MLDEQTRQEFQQNFVQLKPHVQAAFPLVPEYDLVQGQGNPDQLVSVIMEKTGQTREQIEEQVRFLCRRA
jgi:hypothetical protein